jgi:hypothetical protein
MILVRTDHPYLRVGRHVPRVPAPRDLTYMSTYEPEQHDAMHDGGNAIMMQKQKWHKTLLCKELCYQLHISFSIY